MRQNNHVAAATVSTTVCGRPVKKEFGPYTVKVWGGMEKYIDVLYFSGCDREKALRKARAGFPAKKVKRFLIASRMESGLSLKEALSIVSQLKWGHWI